MRFGGSLEKSGHTWTGTQPRRALIFSYTALYGGITGLPWEWNSVVFSLEHRTTTSSGKHIKERRRRTGRRQHACIGVFAGQRHEMTGFEGASSPAATGKDWKSYHAFLLLHVLGMRREVRSSFATVRSFVTAGYCCSFVSLSLSLLACTLALLDLGHDSIRESKLTVCSGKTSDRAHRFGRCRQDQDITITATTSAAGKNESWGVLSVGDSAHRSPTYSIYLFPIIHRQQTSYLIARVVVNFVCYLPGLSQYLL